MTGVDLALVLAVDGSASVNTISLTDGSSGACYRK
jgi:hypothetical protein